MPESWVGNFENQPEHRGGEKRSICRADRSREKISKDRLLVRSVRPQDLETPVALLNAWITPNELEKMIRWGTPVTATERGVLLDYLATNFDRRQSGRPAAAAAARIPDVFQTTGLTCHGSDLVEQQRLGRAGWIREVDKMIRWGASVADTEKDPLVDYLAGRFAP